MERRDFIKNAAALGAGLATTAPVIKAAETTRKAAVGQRSSNGLINIALIGARNQGGRVHLPSIVNHPDLHLVAICDVDQLVLDAAMEQARAVHTEQGKVSEVKAYRDFRELLQRDDLDAVLIATPDHWHVPMTKAAIRAGKDVYVEKPFSLYITEGRDVADLLKEYPQIVQIGSQQRTDEHFLIAAAAVRQGLIGELKGVGVDITTREGSPEHWSPQPVPPELDYDMWLGPALWTEYHSERVHYNFRFVPEYSAGEIGNWGAHHLDIVQLAMGMDDSGPVFVHGSGRRNPPGALHSSFFGIDVDFKYANGVKMKLRSSTGNSGIYFYGSKGRLFVSRGEVRTTPEELLRSFPRGLGEYFRKTKGGHLTNWIRCMKSRRAQDLHASVEVGHRSATICHMANIAIEIGRPLDWDPEKEVFISDGHANAMLNRPVRKGWDI